MRTGFGIASIARVLKKSWIAAFGIVMIIGSVIQYSLINSKLSSNQDSNNSTLDMIPMIYVILSIGTLYLQWNK